MVQYTFLGEIYRKKTNFEYGKFFSNPSPEGRVAKGGKFLPPYRIVLKLSVTQKIAEIPNFPSISDLKKV